MEGYGAQFVAHQKETPGIVVRGISDMAEGKSADADAMNQPVAARRAAAFAFELLSEWCRTYPAQVETIEDVRAQLASASAELRAWPIALSDGHEIPRSELAELESIIDSSSRSTIAVLGKPGSGKSALLANLAHRYAARGWPVLAIKADTLDPNLSSETQLQEHLGLNARPSELLPRLARDHRVLLILDQLDALAGYLDLRTERLSILLGMVRRMGRVATTFTSCCPLVPSSSSTTWDCRPYQRNRSRSNCPSGTWSSAFSRRASCSRLAGDGPGTHADAASAQNLLDAEWT